MATEPLTVIPGTVASGVVLLCDHASNAFPPELDRLGLPEGECLRHIAYDIGAAGLTRRLAGRLGAPAVLSGYSRLLIDCNRGADDPTLIMKLSDGAIVPGNRHVDAAEQARRIRLYYEPYHSAIDALIDQSLAAGIPPVLLSIHTFTPVWKGVPRPWHCGVLWDRDHRLPGPLLTALRAEPDLVVGDNQPYSGRLEGDCLCQHGTRRGLAHAIVEIRQDLVSDDAGEAHWAERLFGIMSHLFADPEARAGLARQCVP